MKISNKSINYCLTNKVIEKIQIMDKQEDKVLCNHCMRTLSNGIRCMGICVADNDYWIKSASIFKLVNVFYNFNINFSTQYIKKVYFKSIKLLRNEIIY